LGLTLTDPETADDVARLQRRLARESAARREAERLLEEKSANLFEAIERLGEETAKVQRLSTAIDVSADGIAITNADGLFTYMNPMHASMFSYSSVDECIGLHWTSLYTPEILTIFERDIFPVFTRDGYWRGDATGRAKDGSAVHQSLSLTALADGGILCSTRDIAIAKRREAQREQLQQMLADAERRDALGRMASSVAHDFANILTTINASARLLGDEISPHSNDTLISRIQTSCRQANALVEDLMSFDSTPVLEARAIDELVTDVVEMMTNQFIGAHRLERIESPERLVCETDPTLFARLVANLVKNAWEALGATGHVIVSTARIIEDEPVDLPFQPSATVHRGELNAYPAARLIVRDDGTGMPQEALDNAFTPFQSSKGRGRGLGLVTVDALLTSQGGRMSVYSRPGDGTVFVLDMPLLEAGYANAERSFLPQDKVHMAAGAIIVDDDPVQVDLGCEAVGRAGWNPVGFTDPTEALKVFRAAPRAFGLVVTDRRMPQMSGDDLVRSLKAIQPGTRVIMCSGALQRPLPVGLAGALHKPASVEALAEMAGSPPDAVNSQTSTTFAD